jgi:hypothetical protein
MTPPGIAPTAAATSEETCLLVQVQTYAPPAELAGAVALWAAFALLAAATIFIGVRAWRLRPSAWNAGFAAGRALANGGGGEVVDFPREPAA